MHITMGGLNHHRVGVDVRERFALAADSLPQVLRAIGGQPGVSGCVILSTCNRMEVYLSHGADTAPDVPALLCAALGMEAGPHRAFFGREAGRGAARYLCEVASGIQSRVLGEDQILAQVKDAITIARQAGTADAVLEALFRTAVTAGKRVKTGVQLFRDGSSVAKRAVEKLDGEWDGRGPARVLVIGNGAMGRLAAGELARRGHRVTVTLRAYRSGGPEIPPGCESILYEDRYLAMEGGDVVVSATTSPHFTMTQERFCGLQNPPGLLIDLAVPRDIEPGVGGHPGVQLWNVDDLKLENPAQNEEALERASGLIEEQLERFSRWHHYRLGGETPQKRREKPAPRPASAGRPRRAAQRTGVPRGKPNFPAFINLDGQKVLVVGGGKIAARRVDVLLRFGADVLLVAPKATPRLEELAAEGAIRWEQRAYEEGDLTGALLAVAATDDRAVNRRVGLAARQRGVLASVADCQAECSFYFPAIVQSESLTAGIVSNHGDHALVRKTAATLRERLDEVEAEGADWQPGEPAGGDTGEDGDGGYTPAVS